MCFSVNRICGSGIYSGEGWSYIYMIIIEGKVFLTLVYGRNICFVINVEVN